MLVNSADWRRQSPAGKDQLPFEFLEHFHVFVLANVLRRPIIIVGEPYLRSITGDSIEPNDVVGIYLPLMSHPLRCIQMPVVLAFLMDHFLPLSWRPSDKSSSVVPAIPLVTASMEPLRVHFLLPSEEAGAHRLLQQYLELVELQMDGDNVVLAAKLTQDEASLDYSQRRTMTVADIFIKHHVLLPKCITENCEFPRVAFSSGMCICCMMHCPPYESLVDDAVKDCFDGTKLSQCANVGCDNCSWMPYGGLCRLCTAGCYPRHYNMSTSEFFNDFYLRKYGT